MGSLALAGAIGGAGEGLQRHVAGRRETRLQDDEQAHQIQLQLQRDKAAETRATSREGFEVSQATVRSEFEVGQSEIASQERLGAAKLRYDQDLGLQTAELGSLEHRSWLDNETKIDVALIQAGSRSGGFGGGAGKYSAHGWDVNFTSDAVLNDDGSTSIVDRVFSYRANDPNIWLMDGNMMIRTGTAAGDIKPIEDPEKRRFVEDTLIADHLGDTNAEDDFISEYGYLPVRYFSELTLDDNEDLAAWVTDRRGSYPYYSGAVQERLGIKSDPWARPGAGGGGAGISITRPGTRGDRARREITVPGERVEEIEVPDIARRPVSPPEMRMTKEAGVIRQGAQAVGDVLGEGVDIAAGAGRQVTGAISRGARAFSDLFAPAEYEEVPPELQ
jgi:hypothetical protein